MILLSLIILAILFDLGYHAYKWYSTSKDERHWLGDFAPWDRETFFGYFTFDNPIFGIGLLNFFLVAGFCLGFLLICFAIIGQI